MVAAVTKMGSSVLAYPTSLAQAETPSPTTHASAPLYVGVLIHLQNELIQHETVLPKSVVFP